MDGLERTIQIHCIPKLLQCHIRFLGQQRTHLTLMPGDDQGLASGQVMPRPYVSASSALGEELFDEAKGYPETPRNSFPGAILFVICR